jgi:branched-chain amino acid transport system ATP-binding protein
MSALLAVRGLTTHYGDFCALDRVDVIVEEGETIAIIGANGAGKSTLLRSIAGLGTITDGVVEFDGRVVTTLGAHRRVGLGIALVPEGRRIFPSLTVEENLQTGAWKGRSGWWTVDRVLELFPLLVARRHASGAVLSGGEQQALAIGRALMSNPRLLLMDEVSLGLAPIVVAQLYTSMPQIIGSGTTVVVVEQDVSQALGVASRVYCLLEGRVSLSGLSGDLSHDRITSAYFGM